MPGWRRSIPRYLITAGLSALSDVGSFALLKELGVFYVHAQMASRIVGGITAFLIHRYWTFHDPQARRIAVQGFRFGVLYAFSYALSVGVLYSLVRFLGLWVYPAKLTADAVCLIVNYLVMRSWVYAAAPEADGPPLSGRAATNLIVCADDFGLAQDVNRAILDLAERGCVSAVSCIVTEGGCDDRDTGLLRRFEAELDIGLHLRLTEVRPISPAASVDSLTDRGRFLPFFGLLKRSLLGRIDPAQVEAEIRAQYERFTAVFGRTPDHIDSHEHVHQLRGVRQGLLRFLAELPRRRRLYVRSSHVPLGRNLTRRLSVLKTMLISLPGRRLRRMLRAAGVATNDDFAGVYDERIGDRRREALRRSLRCMGPGNGILMVHPGLDEPHRRSEYEALLDLPLSRPCRRFALDSQRNRNAGGPA